MKRWLAGTVSVCGMLAAACGQPVISEPVYETPMMMVQGTIAPFPITDFASPRVGVVWIDPLGIEGDIAASSPEVVASSDSEDFVDSSSFHIQFFSPPPARMIRTLVDPISKRGVASFAFGELVLYADGNGGGQLAIGPDDAIVSPDQYWGAGYQDVVFYVSQSLGSNDGPIALKGVLAGPAGYQLAWADCSASLGPVFVPLGDPNPIDVVVAQVVSGTSQLPFVRTCLHSHVDMTVTGMAP